MNPKKIREVGWGSPKFLHIEAKGETELPEEVRTKSKKKYECLKLKGRHDFQLEEVHRWDNWRNDGHYDEYIYLKCSTCGRKETISGENPTKRFKSIVDDWHKQVKEDYAICYCCGIDRYGEPKKEDMDGITVWQGVCPICGKKRTLIPRRDFTNPGWD